MINLKEFIQKELAIRRKHYKENPASIIEHYNIEQQNIEAYNGRQLLEMLQNADDASENASFKNVLIKLKGNQLIIGNNGEPFNEGGFLSITMSNLSPKTMQQNKIGQKGLGFRSILSWADKVVINSGGTKLEFSENIAQFFLQDLLKETPALVDSIKRISPAKFPIATLRVPKLLNGDEDSDVNFDTVITLNLKDNNNILKNVQAQINSVISKETLIFLNHIERIEIDSPERKVVFKKTLTENNTVTIECNDLLHDINESKLWHLNKISGKHEFKDDSKNYELAIAWNDELNDNVNVLFSYFKTQVRFPFPALLHGTFELTQNRNQLEDDTSGHNEFLTDKLAELLIDTALKIASKKAEADYFPLRLLNIDFEKIDQVLTNFKFKEKLEDKILKNKIFPTVNGNYISHFEEPVFYDYPVAVFLNGKDVNNLMPFNDDKQFVEFIKSFELYRFNLEYYFNIISKRNSNCEHLAKLIYLALTYSHYRNELSSAEFKIKEQPEFLIDNEGNAIEWTSKIFIQPKGGIEFKMPKSLKIRFISYELVNALLKLFDTDNIDFLLKELEPFQIRKYSFSEMSETLIQHYTRNRKLTLIDVKELHSFLFRLFKNESKNIKPESISDEIHVPIISTNKRIKFAHEVYFGKHYGNNLTEQLYSFDKSRIIADKAVMGLEKIDSKTVEEYFAWMGVAKLPRCHLKRIETNKEEPYVDYIFKSLRYPLKAGNYSFKSYYEFKNWLPWNLTLQIGKYDEINNPVQRAGYCLSPP